MSKIKEKFAELEERNQKALIAYIMTGFPNEKATLTVVRGLVKGGIDIIELGFPFSDPSSRWSSNTKCKYNFT